MPEAHSPAAVQIAAALVMGADGVAIGTRLNCTPESTYPEHKKKALLGAGGPFAHQQKRLDLDINVRPTTFKETELTSPSCCAGSDAAATKATVRTTLYDDIGTRGWETMDGVDGRALHNDFIDVSCNGAGLGR